MSGRSRTGDDPTRTCPGGSRTETKITNESELGSDRAGDDEVKEDPTPSPPETPRTPISRR